MHTTDSIHKALWAKFPQCNLEYKATIAGVDYGAGDIVVKSTPGSLYSSNGPSVGATMCRTLTADIRTGLGAIPSAAKIDLWVRLTLDSQAGSWIKKGTYYIDTRSPDTFNEWISVEAYDAMLSAEQPYLSEDEELEEWPRPMDAVMEDIAAIMGVGIDPRTYVNPSYMVEYPNDLTCREILGYIAAAMGGNFCMSDDGLLYLVPLRPEAPVMDAKQELIDWSLPPAFSPFTGVRVFSEDIEFTAGNLSGRVLEAECEWATQAMADNIYADIRGYAYQPYTATEAAIDPAVELGDSITIMGADVVCATLDPSYDPMPFTSASAPGEQEIDHEYPYTAHTQRELQRKVGLGKSYFGCKITRKDGLVIQKITDPDGQVIGEVVLNSDKLSMRALNDDGNMEDCIFFDAPSRTYKIVGRVSIDGALYANSLYSDKGDIAELTVDYLDTSHKIAKYLTADTSDDNHILAHDQMLQFISAEVQRGHDGQPLTMQLLNRYGQKVYWEADISEAEIVNGHPEIDGVVVSTTTDPTDWPCIVYQYRAIIKREIRFEESGNNEPIDVWGAGIGHPDYPDAGKGIAMKDVESFSVTMQGSDGETRGMVIKDDHTEIMGLRRTVSIDFSHWDTGWWSETLSDGTTLNYGVEFDSQNRPLKISDGTNEVKIEW